MASPSGDNPTVEIQLSFDRSTHSYSQSEPPRIKLMVVSRALHPIAIFTWRTPLDPKGALLNAGYAITDLTTGQSVKTTKYMCINRGPILRARGDSDASFYLTLLPNVPAELSTGFGRRGGGVKSDPRSVVERGRERDEHGNERSARRSTNATGVDGHEPNHHYAVSLNAEALRSCLWAPVTKDEILVDAGGPGAQLRDYPWSETPLNFNVGEAALHVLE